MKRILLIDDEEGIRIVWKRFHDLAEPVFRGQLEMDVASDLELGIKKMEENEYDAVICDVKVPPHTPEQVIAFVGERSHDPKSPPFIMLTGDEDIFMRRRCMMAGAAGFWIKADAAARPDLFFKSVYNAYLKRHAERS